MITVPLFQRNWPPAPSAAVKSQSYEIISSACAQDRSASCLHRLAFQPRLKEWNLHRPALWAVGLYPPLSLPSEPEQFSTPAAQGTAWASPPALDPWMGSMLPALTRSVQSSGIWDSDSKIWICFDYLYMLGFWAALTRALSVMLQEVPRLEGDTQKDAAKDLWVARPCSSGQSSTFLTTTRKERYTVGRGTHLRCTRSYVQKKGTLGTKTWPMTISWSPTRPGTLAYAHSSPCALWWQDPPLSQSLKYFQHL